MARWLSWLERRPVTAEVVGSSPIRVVFYCHFWGLSSAGRASALQAEGHRFEPCRPHSFIILRHYFGGELADVAQLAEQLICNQQVIGSSPIVGSTRLIGILDGFPSGQRGQTVNLLATLSVVRIHLHPLAYFIGNVL